MGNLEHNKSLKKLTELLNGKNKENRTVKKIQALFAKLCWSSGHFQA